MYRDQGLSEVGAVAALRGRTREPVFTAEVDASEATIAQERLAPVFAAIDATPRRPVLSEAAVAKIVADVTKAGVDAFVDTRNRRTKPKAKPAQLREVAR